MKKLIKEKSNKMSKINQFDIVSSKATYYEGGDEAFVVISDAVPWANEVMIFSSKGNIEYRKNSDLTKVSRMKSSSISKYKKEIKKAFDGIEYEMYSALRFCVFEPPERIKSKTYFPRLLDICSKGQTRIILSNVSKILSDSLKEEQEKIELSKKEYFEKLKKKIKNDRIKQKNA